jgi:hypothetical protein
MAMKNRSTTLITILRTFHWTPHVRDQETTMRAHRELGKRKPLNPVAQEQYRLQLKNYKQNQATSEALARRSDWSSRRTESNTGRTKIGDSKIQHGRFNPWPCGRILGQAHGPVKTIRGDDREMLVGLSAGWSNLPGTRLGSEQAVAREKSHAADPASSSGEINTQRGKILTRTKIGSESKSGMQILVGRWAQRNPRPIRCCKQNKDRKGIGSDQNH